MRLNISNFVDPYLGIKVLVLQAARHQSRCARVPPVVAGHLLALLRHVPGVADTPRLTTAQETAPLSLRAVSGR